MTSHDTMDQLTDQIVAQYLRDHPDFLASWFIDHADDDTLKILARKLKQDAISLQNSRSPVPSPAPELGSDRYLTVDNSSGSNVDCSGGAEDEISHSENKEIQKYNTFSKVGRNSITSLIFRKYLDGDRMRRASVKKDLDDLRRMSEEELFMELIRDIASELDVNVLCHKILQNVGILTNGDRGSLFLVRGSRDQRFLVSKLFDVTECSTLEESIHTQANEITVPFGVGIAGNVAKTRMHINIKDVYADPRFNQEVDKKTGYRTHSILSMPILNFEGEVIGVAQIINKVTGNHEFTQQDEEIFRKYLTFCGIGITNAQLFEMSVNEFKRNQLLLHLARGIFEEQSNLEKLVQKIMLDAQDLLKCEKCSVYLLEDSFERDIIRFSNRFLNRLGSYSRNSNLVVAMQDPSNPRKAERKTTLPEKEKKPPPEKAEDVIFSQAFELHEGQIKVPSAMELATSKIAQIARCTVVEGEPLNVEDLAKDGRFGSGPFTEENGFTTKSVLCMPIHNSDRTIIGVTQLINKVNGQPFDDNDEHIIEAFSIFTGLGIHNCQMYENACQLMAKQSVALEVLSYHATANKEEAEKFKEESIKTSEEYRLYTYDFDDMVMTDDDTIKATIRMFMDADLINQFKIPYETMCRWVCTVKKNYRPVTYHNWRHAFNVCQTMFTMLYTGELKPLFDSVEIFALMAACLCHDLDHRGTNNAFQVKVASPLAMLYSTSVLEHHHFDHCIMILNSEGNNIFQSFTPEEYRRGIKILEHAILSTDLALYFKKRGDFKTLVERGEKNFKDAFKKDLLKAMMMTACDVAAITKPWKIQKEVAQLVTAEFFEQGDIEKIQLGQKPIPMMDREKKDELPRMQVDFIDMICTPVYEGFSKLWPRLSAFYDGLMLNRHKWQLLFEEGRTPSPPRSASKLITPEKRKSAQLNGCVESLRGQQTNSKDDALQKIVLPKVKSTTSEKSHSSLRLQLSPLNVKRHGQTSKIYSSSLLHSPGRTHKTATSNPSSPDKHPVKSKLKVYGTSASKAAISQSKPGSVARSPLFSKISTRLKPLHDGCSDNRKHWEELAKENKAKDESSANVNEKGKSEQENSKDGSRTTNQKINQETETSYNKTNETSVVSESKNQNCVNTSNHISSQSKTTESKTAPSSNHSVHITNQEGNHTKANVKSKDNIILVQGIKEDEKKRSLRSSESKKSTKSSKSNLCSVS